MTHMKNTLLKIPGLALALAVTMGTSGCATNGNTAATPDAATNSQNNQSKPKEEEAASTQPSQSSETKAAEPEPACN